jgi:hypothetical protein
MYIINEQKMSKTTGFIQIRQISHPNLIILPAKKEYLRAVIRYSVIRITDEAEENKVDNEPLSTPLTYIIKPFRRPTGAPRMHALPQGKAESGNHWEKMWNFR